MKKQKPDPKQLLFEFGEAVTRFKKAADNLEATAKALLRSPGGKAAVTKVARSPEATELAQRLNKIVRVHAAHKKLHWREVWHLLYFRLWEKTGFDAEARGLANRIRPLDAVLSADMGEKLLKEAEVF